MGHLIWSMVMLIFVLGACGKADGGPADPASEEQLYSLFFDEVLERGEKWWGYPPPAEYCVAIAPAGMEPSLENSTAPSQEVLDDLGQAHPGKTFHPVSHCSKAYPFTAPAGEPAGLLWVAPLETTDRVTLSGGWTAQRDMTEWECTFLETQGVVELQECVLKSET